MCWKISEDQFGVCFPTYSIFCYFIIVLDSLFPYIIKSMQCEDGKIAGLLEGKIFFLPASDPFSVCRRVSLNCLLKKILSKHSGVARHSKNTVICHVIKDYVWTWKCVCMCKIIYKHTSPFRTIGHPNSVQYDREMKRVPVDLHGCNQKVTAECLGYLDHMNPSACFQTLRNVDKKQSSSLLCVVWEQGIWIGINWQSFLISVES